MTPLLQIALCFCAAIATIAFIVVLTFISDIVVQVTMPYNVVLKYRRIMTKIRDFCESDMGTALLYVSVFALGSMYFALYQLEQLDWIRAWVTNTQSQRIAREYDYYLLPYGTL